MLAIALTLHRQAFVGASTSNQQYKQVKNDASRFMHLKKKSNISNTLFSFFIFTGWKHCEYRRYSKMLYQGDRNIDHLFHRPKKQHVIYSFALGASSVGVIRSLMSEAASPRQYCIRSEPRPLLTMLNWMLFSLIMQAILLTKNVSTQAHPGNKADAIVTYPKPSSTTWLHPQPLKYSELSWEVLRNQCEE